MRNVWESTKMQNSMKSNQILTGVLKLILCSYFLKLRKAECITRNMICETTRAENITHSMVFAFTHQKLVWAPRCFFFWYERLRPRWSPPTSLARENKRHCCLETSAKKWSCATRVLFFVCATAARTIPTTDQRSGQYSHEQHFHVGKIVSVFQYLIHMLYVF